mmetsp:Transcript_9127/g.29603  ORF Transcript_9127/g.29603 Transcript_9127/m.29603 type:complete len:207 (-) Transcript_9127:24-644(-)
MNAFHSPVLVRRQSSHRRAARCARTNDRFFSYISPKQTSKQTDCERAPHLIKRSSQPDLSFFSFVHPPKTKACSASFFSHSKEQTRPPPGLHKLNDTPFLRPPTMSHRSAGHKNNSATPSPPFPKLSNCRLRRPSSPRTARQGLAAAAVTTFECGRPSLSLRYPGTATAHLAFCHCFRLSTPRKEYQESASVAPCPAYIGTSTTHI